MAIQYDTSKVMQICEQPNNSKGYKFMQYAVMQ